MSEIIRFKTAEYRKLEKENTALKKQIEITKEKIITAGDINKIVQILSRNLPLEIGGKICNGKLFEQIASEILGDDKK